MELALRQLLKWGLEWMRRKWKKGRRRWGRRRRKESRQIPRREQKKWSPKFGEEGQWQPPIHLVPRSH